MKEQYTVVTRKGQITVPAEIRKALGLHIGDRVAVSLDEDGQLPTLYPFWAWVPQPECCAKGEG
jgi:AbrB family looped-hinge helix DNA binding protein